MSDQSRHDVRLVTELEGALALLADYPAATLPDQFPLPSLLEECEMLCDRIAAEPPVLLRSLHHFACTGGTLISKCVGALPNTVLLSEIDPLSTWHLQEPHRPFFPTDILADLEYNPRLSDPDLIVEVFLAGLIRMRDLLNERGMHLILRDHAHSQFCTNSVPEERPTLHEILATRAPVRAAVTLRHPLDSYLSLTAQNWRHFDPFTLEEYCLRYDKFLDRHAELPWFRYEDFVADPEMVLSQISAALDLPYSPAALDAAAVMRLSGDSGRGGIRISPRPRRNVPAEVSQQLLENTAFETLCRRMGYEP